MAAVEVIDLLSSDSEAPPKIAKTPQDFRCSSHSFSALTPVSPHSLPRDIDFDQEWMLGPAAKKQKLSPLIQEKSQSGLRVFGRDRSNQQLQSSGDQVTKSAEIWTFLDDDDDPITFSSSAPINNSAGKAIGDTEVHVSKSASFNADDSDSLPENIDEATAGERKSKNALSDKTASLLANLKKPSIPNSRRSQATQNAPHTIIERPRGFARHGSAPVTTAVSCDDKNARRNGQAKKVPEKTIASDGEKALRRDEKEREKSLKAAARQHAKEQKERDKEQELIRKRVEKEEQAKEKRHAAAIAEANKLKIDKKETVMEMIVDLPVSMQGHTSDIQVREILRNLKVEASSYQSSIPNVIKWRRKVRAEWRKDLDRWEPLSSMRIDSEQHVACVMPAKEFVSLAIGQDGQDLESHVTRLRNAEPGCIPLYVVEGLKEWRKQNKNETNRAYQAQVLGQDMAEDGSNGGKSRGRRKKAPHQVVDPSVIDDALLRLQVLHGCLIHQTEVKETAEWLAIFTQSISTGPQKKRQMELDTTFCLESGQVETGVDEYDTYVKMLKEVVRVTEPMAHGIALIYPNVGSLFRGFREKGPLILEDVRRTSARNGVSTDQRIGPAISRRLYHIFMGTDPTSTEV